MIVFFSPAHIRGSKCAPTHTNKSLRRAAGRCGGEIISGTCGLMRAIIQPHTHRSCATRTVTVMGFCFSESWSNRRSPLFASTRKHISAHLLPAAQADDVTHKRRIVFKGQFLYFWDGYNACMHACILTHTHTHVIPRKTSWLCVFVSSGLNQTLTTFQYGPNLQPFHPPTPPSPGATPLPITPPTTSRTIELSLTSIPINRFRSFDGFYVFVFTGLKQRGR